MIVEQRTYTLVNFKLRPWLAVYEKYGLALQTKYLGGLIGFFVTDIGPLNQVIHLWKYDSLADRERRRAELVKDPAWPEFLKHSAELAAIQDQESKIMVPTSFSPMR